MVPEETLRSLQQEYFPDYSTEVIMIELIAVLENFKQFIKENNKMWAHYPLIDRIADAIDNAVMTAATNTATSRV